MALRAVWSKAVVVAGLLAAPAVACPDAGSETVRVGEVLASGDLRLEDGRLLRLAGLWWPEAGRRTERERLAGALRAHVGGMPVLAVLRGPPDRWGRHPADLFAPGGQGRAPLWLQGDLAEEGLARLWPEPAARPCRIELQEREFLARQARTGVWSALGQRPPRTRLPVAQRLPNSSRMIFEGTVHSVRRGRSMTFVNFAGRRDVVPSLLLPRRMVTEMTRSGRDPATFAGKRLILRAEFRPSPRPALFVGAPEAVEVIE